MIKSKEKLNHQQIIDLSIMIENLCLYRAELAKILGLKCEDVNDCRRLEGFLSCHSDYSVKVDRLILFYRLLDKKFDGNLALMLHWFRKSHDHLKNSPFLAMVDHQEVEKVIELFNIDS